MQPTHVRQALAGQALLSPRYTCLGNGTSPNARRGIEVVERRIRFDRGTILLQGFSANEVTQDFVLDGRVGLYRGPAIAYRGLITKLHRAGIPYSDEARAYAPLGRPRRGDRAPRPYQAAAVQAWVEGGKRGVIVLPTGSGKSFVAELCIAASDRSCLVVAPTLNLVGQWYDQLKRSFPGPIGVLGGGVHTVEALTVSTYDSAHLHVSKYGDRFGLLVFDEVHHLPWSHPTGLGRIRVGAVSFGADGNARAHRRGT